MNTRVCEELDTASSKRLKALRAGQRTMLLQGLFLGVGGGGTSEATVLCELIWRLASWMRRETHGTVRTSLALRGLEEGDNVSCLWASGPQTWISRLCRQGGGAGSGGPAATPPVVAPTGDPPDGRHFLADR